MAKTSVKFQNDWPKPVGGVALTRHPLTIRVLGKKLTKLTKQKKLKKKSENYEQTICTFTHHGQNICEKKSNRKVQVVPQSQTAALPRPKEEEETDKSKQAQTEQTYEKH